MANHYVDNKRLYTEMIKYINEYNAAKKEGKQPPQASEYIGQCIWLIANRLSTNRNFIGYTYREEMIGDAIENCIRYLHNFDPDKSNNPFAYFTQIMYYAFLRRIEKEKKQTYVKYKTMENSIINGSFAEMSHDELSHLNSIVTNVDSDKMAALAEKYDPKPRNKPKKKGLENFVVDIEE